jgi:hypothetical protein
MTEPTEPLPSSTNEESPKKQKIVGPMDLVYSGGPIAGVIDWGDLAVGDRATDLAALSYLLPEQHLRQQALVAHGEMSEAILTRAKGWAILFGVILLDSGLVDHVQHATIGQKIPQCIAQASVM